MLSLKLFICLVLLVPVYRIMPVLEVLLETLPLEEIGSQRAIQRALIYFQMVSLVSRLYKDSSVRNHRLWVIT